MYQISVFDLFLSRYGHTSTYRYNSFKAGHLIRFSRNRKNMWSLGRFRVNPNLLEPQLFFPHIESVSHSIEEYVLYVCMYVVVNYVSCIVWVLEIINMQILCDKYCANRFDIKRFMRKNLTFVACNPIVRFLVFFRLTHSN